MPAASLTLPSVESHVRAHRRRKEARPQELLDAALDVFVERGYALAKTDEVATRAGVAKGTLYLYYPSKDALLMAVVRHFLGAPIAASAERFVDHEGPQAELIREAMVTWWIAAFNGRASAVMKLMVAESRAFPEIATVYAEEVIEPADRMLGALLERGMASGEFRRVDVQDAVRSLVFPLVMLCVQKHSLGACAVPSCNVAHSPDDARRFIGHHVDLILAGLQQGANKSKRPPTRQRRAPSR